MSAGSPTPHKPTIAMATSQRNVSGPLPLDALSASSENSLGSNWRTNPHSSSPLNKTSQYIEKITAENERLRRELRAERLAREEEGKRVGAARAKAEDSRTELQHLQVLADTNARAAERKERKLEEMKAALEAEKKRREAAEKREAESLALLSEMRSEMQKELAQAREMQHYAETTADAAREGYKRITDGYEHRIRLMNQELANMRQGRIIQADQIRRQGLLSDQIQSLASRRLRADGDLGAIITAHKAEYQREIDRLVQEAEGLRTAIPAREAEAEALVKEMEETKNKMKWVMANKKRQDRK